VVVNAGCSGPDLTDIDDDDPEFFDEVIQKNYSLGLYSVAHHLLPPLHSQPPAGKSPKAFFIVESTASFTDDGLIANTQHCVSKLAQLKLVENIHDRYKNRGVLAAVVHPGAVLSDMSMTTTPDGVLQYGTDDSSLCGAFMMWLLRPRSVRRDLMWLGGRCLAANWDVDELLTRKDEIISRNLLKARLAL